MVVMKTFPGRECGSKFLLLIGDDDDPAHPTPSDNDDVPDLSIIQKCFIGHLNQRTLRLGGKNRPHSLQVLVDSGSTTIFCNLKWIND